MLQLGVNSALLLIEKTLLWRMLLQSICQSCHLALPPELTIFIRSICGAQRAGVCHRAPGQIEEHRSPSGSKFS